MNKYFFLDTKNKGLTESERDELKEIRSQNEKDLNNDFIKRKSFNKQSVHKKQNKLKAPIGRVIVCVDLDAKNIHTFSNGTKISLERNNNNLNRREVAPVNAIVLSSDYMPEGSEVLISHNAVHDVNRLFNFTPLSGESEASEIKYYSLPDSECFVYREQGETEWTACKGYATGLRLFKPYNGVLQNISPTVVKNKLFITSGSLKNKVVCTLKACDYTIVYQESNGREGQIIRCRHFDTEELHERQEVIAVDEAMTQQIFNGELLVGITISDAKNVYVKNTIELPKQLVCAK